MSEQPRSRPDPYADASQALWAAGWRGVLPLPHKRKQPPPDDCTGHAGRWPSFADVTAWSEDGPHNVALRLPLDVVGIDVDDYAGKVGGATMRLAAERLGPLPATWRSTSREQSTSGIYLYRVPVAEDGHVGWAGQVGADVEIIQTRHRYVVAPPSVHPNGGTYRWVRPDGTTSLAPPTPDGLAELPAAWVEAYGMRGAGRGVVGAGLDDHEVGEWVAGRPAGPVCERMLATLLSCVDDLASGARHDAALRATLRLAREGQRGHAGLLDALRGYQAAWLAACAQPARGRLRSADEALREWSGLLASAVDLVAVDPARDWDPCTYPLAGLLAPGPSRAALDALAERLARRESGDDGGLDGLQLDGVRVDDERLVEAGLTPADGLLVEQDVQRELRRLLAREIATEVRGGQRFTTPLSRGVDVDLLDGDDEPHWLVESVLPEGSNVLLTSSFKAGKTTLVNHLAGCLADARPFLGAFAVREPVNVALWNYEVGAGMYRRWLRALDVQDWGRVQVAHLRGLAVPLASREGRAWAVETLRASNTRVWIVDPFARAFGGESENDNAEVGRWLDVLDSVKAAAGVGELLVVTHTGRSEAAQERARGATRLDDWCDVRWLLVRGEDDARAFHATGRDVEQPKRLLHYDEERRGLLLLDASPSDARDGELQAVLLDAVRGQPGIGLAALRTFARNRLGSASSARVDRARDALASQGLIVVTVSEPGRPTGHWPHDPNGGLIGV